MSTVKEFLGVEELSTIALYRKIFAEFMGTFIFLYIGLASTIGWVIPSEVMDIALTMGLAISAAIAVVGHVSGGELNPAVSIGLLLTRDSTLVRVLLYILAQLLGATVAACLLSCSLPKDSPKFGLTKPIVSNIKALLVECLITFVLMLVVKACADPNRPGTKYHNYFTIGFAVLVCNAGAISFSGAGMNPARSFGPALVMKDFQHHWIYWVGPIIGSALGSVVYYLFFRESAKTEE